MACGSVAAVTETTETVAPETLEALRLLLTVNRRVVDHLAREMAEENQLPLAWYEVLLYLREADEGRLRMHELADSLLLSRSAATRFVDRMEDAGLVDRVVCASDRRGTFVEMTETGRAVFAAAAPIHLRGIAAHFARYVSSEEADVLVAAFGRICDADA
jgi:DNA-binding MarR family transcriptional regulator